MVRSTPCSNPDIPCMQQFLSVDSGIVLWPDIPSFLRNLLPDILRIADGCSLISNRLLPGIPRSLCHLHKRCSSAFPCNIAIPCPVIQVVAFMPSFPWDIVKNLVIISIALKKILLVYHNTDFLIDFYPMPSRIPFDVYTEDS